MRDRRRRRRPLVRSPAGAARDRDARARARHRGGRGERAQRRVPDRRHGRLLRGRTGAPRRRGGATDLRTHAGGAEGDLRAGRRAGRGRCGPPHGPAARVRLGGGGGARAPARRRPESRRLPRCAGGARRTAGGAAGQLPQRVLHRPRRRTAAGALDPGAGAGRGAGRRAHPRAHRGPRAGAGIRGRLRRRHRPRRARDRRRRRCPAGAGARVRRSRAHAAPAHGRHRGVARAAGGLPRIRALGLRVLPAGPGRQAAGGRLLGSRRRAVVHGPRRGEPGGLGAHPALPGGGPRRPGPDHAPLGGQRRLQPATGCRSSARPRACTRPAGTPATATCSATSRARPWPTSSPASGACCPGSAGAALGSAAGRCPR